MNNLYEQHQSTNCEENSDDANEGDTPTLSHPPPSDDCTFLLDSAAHPSQVIHHTPFMQKLTTPLLTHTSTVADANATHIGKLQSTTNLGVPFCVPAIAYPKLRDNLLSVHQLSRMYGLVAFTPQKAYIFDTRKQHNPVIVGYANNKNGLYRLKPKIASQSLSSRTVNVANNSDPSIKSSTTTSTKKNHNISKLIVSSPRAKPIPLSKIKPPISPPIPIKTFFFHAYHLIFNHISLLKLQEMAKSELLPLPNILKQPPPKLTYAGCHNGKLRPKPHRATTHSYTIGIAMSSDICGPIKPRSHHGNSYFIIFIDLASRYLIVYFMKDGQNVARYIQDCINETKSITGQPPHILRTDKAKEYTSKLAKDIYRIHGIQFTTIIPHSPQQNSIAERINNTLMAAARASLKHSELPNAYWEDAVRDSVYKYNLTVHSTTQSLPFTMYHGHPPTLNRMFPFGQLGSIPVLTSIKKKLQPRGIHVRYMYSINPDQTFTQNIHTGIYITAREVDFHPYYHSSDPVHTTTYSFKSHIPHKTPIIITPSTPAPSSTKQAHCYPDHLEWVKAHDLELETLDRTETIQWIASNNLPKGTSAIPLTVKYRYKTDSNGVIIQRKARCTLRGDLMIPYVHFDPAQTSAHMADRTSIRTIIAFAAASGYHLEHFDISSAYLHENASPCQCVYVEQPARFNGNLKHEGNYGLLKKNLYGGKSAGFIYTSGVTSFLDSNCYIPSPHDPLVFTKKTPDEFIIIGVSSDDFAVCSSSVKSIDNLFRTLQHKYNIKRLGFPTKYLGWSTNRNQQGEIHIS